MPAVLLLGAAHRAERDGGGADRWGSAARCSRWVRRRSSGRLGRSRARRGRSRSAATRSASVADPSADRAFAASGPTRRTARASTGSATSSRPSPRRWCRSASAPRPPPGGPCPAAAPRSRRVRRRRRSSPLRRSRPGASAPTSAPRSTSPSARRLPCWCAFGRLAPSRAAWVLAAALAAAGAYSRSSTCERRRQPPDPLGPRGGRPRRASAQVAERRLELSAHNFSNYATSPALWAAVALAIAGIRPAAPDRRLVRRQRLRLGRLPGRDRGRCVRDPGQRLGRARC